MPLKVMTVDLKVAAKVRFLAMYVINTLRARL